MSKCKCGCGQDTLVEQRNRRAEGRRKGESRDFVHGHNARKAVTTVVRRVTTPDGGSMLLHRVRAERALGRPLPATAEVHHVGRDRSDTASLVICEDHKYHSLLHARMRVKEAGGNPNTDAICGVCRKVKARAEFGPSSRGVFGVKTVCRQCRRNDRQVAARG